MERLKREGVKTHKERVEELNKYLSRLSEHHDMYVLFISYSLVRRHGLTCAAIGRRLGLVKWGLETFLLYTEYVRILFSSPSIFVSIREVLLHELTRFLHLSSSWTQRGPML